GVSLLVWNPQSIWVKAGLHTGDRVSSINSTRITTWPQLRQVLGALRVGDTARVEVQRASGPYTAAVAITGWQQPRVSVTEIPNATPQQRQLRARWLRAQ
ncbi:MAG TPA: PDZ domain-containing protein, partial [Longimicrobiales bacterium]